MPKMNDFYNQARLMEQKKRSGKKAEKIYNVSPKRVSEQSMIEAYDNQEALTKFATAIEMLEKTKDVGAFLGAVSPKMAIELVCLASNGDNKKVQLSAIQDILDRAGYGKVNKHAVARVSVTESKDALISLLLGANNALKAEGIEIVEDDNDNQDKDK